MGIHKFGTHFGEALSCTLVLPFLEKLSVHLKWNKGALVDEEQIRALVDLLQHDSKIKMFEIEMVSMNDESAVLFAETFRANTTIKHLHLERHAFLSAGSALAFVRALPESHSLESIHFNGEMTTWYNERVLLPNIIEVLGHTQLRTISVTGLYLQDEIVQQILDTLQRISHHFTKVDIVYPDAWRKKIQHQTYENHESVIRQKWMDNYFNETPRTPMNEDLFIAIMHAKKADKEQPFPSPNILYKLMRAVAMN
jgi:hypothetical protein